nr:hypothetical protein [uncultured Draconibacterium sp.]
MKKLGRLFKYKMFWLITAILFIVFVWPAKQLFVWFGFSVDSLKSNAKRLKIAMQYFGTDEKELWNLLEPMSKRELEEVYIEFGLQRYEYGGRFWFGSPLDLFGWFSKELNAKEKTRMREIWSKTNLEITF